MISIIVTCYNLENLISKAIESVINQTDNNYELIVVDDASIDNSLTTINSYKDYIHKLIVNPINRGIGYSKKIGGESASGDHILFLDGDDTIENNTVEVLNKYQNIDLIFSPVKIIGEDRTFISKYESIDEFDCATFNSYCISTELFKKSNFSTLRFYEDMDSAIRLKYNAKSILFIKDCLYNHFTFEFSACGTADDAKRCTYICLATINNIEYFKDKDFKSHLINMYCLKQKFKEISRYTTERDSNYLFIEKYINDNTK